MRFPLIVIVRLTGLPWWRPKGWWVLTPAQWAEVDKQIAAEKVAA